MKTILINLLSQQRIQNLIAIKHIQPDVVVALSTKDFEHQIETFESVANVAHKKILIEAYDLTQNLQILDRVAKQYINDHLIINYTGGTKVMALSAILRVLLSASQKVELIYVNSRDLKIDSILVNEDKTLKSSETDLKIHINITDYFTMMGETLDQMDTSLSENEQERINLSKRLMYERIFSKLFKKQKTFFDKKGSPLLTHSITFDNVDLFWDNQEFRIKTSKKLLKYNHGDGGVYLTGSWLEELVFNKMVESHRFDECAKNVLINYKEQETDYNKNEIDVVVRKGFKTAFIECKAGNVTQDHVYKLKSITNYYLGAFGVPVLYSKFKPQLNVVEKCKDLGVHLFSGQEFKYLEFEIKKLLN